MKHECITCRHLHGKLRIVDAKNKQIATKKCYRIEEVRRKNGPPDEGSIEDMTEKRLGGTGRVNITANTGCRLWQARLTQEEIAERANYEAQLRMTTRQDTE